MSSRESSGSERASSANKRTCFDGPRLAGIYQDKKSPDDTCLYLLAHYDDEVVEGIPIFHRFGVTKKTPYLPPSITLDDVDKLKQEVTPHIPKILRFLKKNGYRV